MDYPTTQHKVIQSQLAHGKGEETQVCVCLVTLVYVSPLTLAYRCSLRTSPNAMTIIYLALTKLRFAIGTLHYIRKYT